MSKKTMNLEPKTVGYRIVDAGESPDAPRFSVREVYFNGEGQEVLRWFGRKVVEALIADVNERAEADILKGNPITGAHHRALDSVDVHAIVESSLANQENHVERESYGMRVAEAVRDACAKILDREPESLDDAIKAHADMGHAESASTMKSEKLYWLSAAEYIRSLDLKPIIREQSAEDKPPEAIAIIKQGRS